MDALDKPTGVVDVDAWLCKARTLCSRRLGSHDNGTIISEHIISVYEKHYKHLLEILHKNGHITTDNRFLEDLCNRRQTGQRTPEWYAETVNIITASEIGQLLGGKRKRDQLISSKLHIVPKWNKSAVSSACMSPFDWGIRFEPVAKQIYIHKYGVSLKELGRLYDLKDPKNSASPDALVYDDKTGKRTGRLVEIKCPVTRENVDGVIPDSYYSQIQMQLHVSGCQLCDYVEVQFSSPYSKPIERTGPCLFSGCIVLILNETVYRYEYSPIYATVEWEPTLLPGDEIMEKIPWEMFSWQEILVRRDEEWWKSVEPMIADFWKDVERARRGEYEFAETRSRQPKCLIRIPTSVNEKVQIEI